MLNQVTLQGRMVNDPEFGVTVHTANGDRTKYTFTVATQDEFGKKNTHFVPCAAWGKTGEFIRKWFKKGYMIFITGRITTYKDFSISGGDTRVEILVEHADFPPREEPIDDKPIETVDEDLPF